MLAERRRNRISGGPKSQHRRYKGMEVHWGFQRGKHWVISLSCDKRWLPSFSVVGWIVMGRCATTSVSEHVCVLLLLSRNVTKWDIEFCLYLAHIFHFHSLRQPFLFLACTAFTFQKKKKRGIRNQLVHFMMCLLTSWHWVGTYNVLSWEQQMLQEKNHQN